MNKDIVENAYVISDKLAEKDDLVAVDSLHNIHIHTYIMPNA